VLAKVNSFPLQLIGHSLVAELNVLPLGSYDILTGMDSLEMHWSLINCKTKTISYMDEEGKRQEIQGIIRPLKLRTVTNSQLEKCI